MIATYSGLSIEQMNDLREQVRAKSARIRVLKNNLFRKALEANPAFKDVAPMMKDVLHGPIAVAFTEGDLPAVSKTILEFSKKNDKVKIMAGCFELRPLDQKAVAQIADLPSREQLLSIIGRGLNTPATKIATGINQIMASLARGIKAVGEKNG
ncbi:MAG: 50S ribosomal protein L10 [Leptospirales bacterium]|nr:50S ribosomal protein L10 [Leptospirales bacterium]